MNKFKIAYYVSTGLLTLMMLGSAGMYLFNTADVQEVFVKLGYPAYIVIPLAIVKLAGIATIWFVKNKSLKEWAYAGFFFDFVLAFTAHVMVGDGEQWASLFAAIMLLSSYFSMKQLEK